MTPHQNEVGTIFFCILHPSLIFKYINIKMLNGNSKELLHICCLLHANNRFLQKLRRANSDQLVATAQTEQMFPLADRQSYQKGKKSRGLDWLTGP